MDEALFKTAVTYQAVIFDFDGVLARIYVDWPALKEHLCRFIAEETGAYEDLTPFDLQLNRLLKTAPAALTEKVNQIIKSYELKNFDRHLVFPELLDVAKKLSDHGVLLFICSSNTREVIEKILDKTGASGCFRQIVSREDVQQRKPDPEGLCKIISENRLEAEKVLFIGDREVDQKAGKAAGIETRLVKPSHSMHLSELPPSPFQPLETSSNSVRPRI